MLFNLYGYSKDYNILNAGAVEGGSVICTQAITKTVSTRHQKSGGGRVIIPNGTFLTGTIIIKSNVELHLENEATLLGSHQSR